MTAARSSTELAPNVILVASDSASDAAQVSRQLQEEFGKVVTSIDADLAASDFERHQPGVLVLAFNTLEKAERYYLGLYRLCPAVQQVLHRTVILCNKDEVKQVYELCKKHHFDDYVLYWPMTYDMARLGMTVHHALRELNTLHSMDPTAAEFAAPARRLEDLQTMMTEGLPQGMDFAKACAPHLASVRALTALAERYKPTLLVVDDDEFQRKILARILGSENYQLLFATSGLEALNQLRKTRPDLILMDVKMPGMDGVEVTRRLKETPRFASIPVVMITGQSDRSVVTDSLKAGAIGFVVKPFDRDKLLAKVAQGLGGA
ncbi:MAG: response regulator [Comamonadaceae bacterium CG_4_9_14_0_8_um_filter_57_21]|nr:MAG: response regulator [Comamonadaceae bacterium CG_4_9_14_0_8_um_filter_57_21]